MSNFKCLPTCANLTCRNSFWITSLSSHKTFLRNFSQKHLQNNPDANFTNYFRRNFFASIQAKIDFKYSQTHFLCDHLAWHIILHQFMPKNIFTNIQTNTFSVWPRSSVTYYFASIHAKEDFYKFTNIKTNTFSVWPRSTVT